MTDIVQRCGRLEKYVGRIRSKRHKVLKGVLREQLESTGLLHDVLVLLLWELTAHCYRLLAVSKFERAIGPQMFAGQKLLAPSVQSAQLVVRLFLFCFCFCVSPFFSSVVIVLADLWTCFLFLLVSSCFFLFLLLVSSSCFFIFSSFFLHSLQMFFRLQSWSTTQIHPTCTTRVARQWDSLVSACTTATTTPSRCTTCPRRFRQ